MSTQREKQDLFGTTAFTLLQNESFLTSGCSNIDNALRGGFSRKGITQIYGQAGTGKTQIALQLCLTVQIPSISQTEPFGAVYICTEATFPSKRLSQLLKKSPITKKFSISSDVIFVEHVSSMEKLEECICQKIPFLLQHRKIGLLVVDSIAAPFRVEYYESELKNRARILRKIGEQLHFISSEYNIPIICVNQASAMMSNELLSLNAIEEQPALGIVWANLISHSFRLYRNNDRRFMHIMHSSCLPYETIEYEIRDIGIIGV